MIETSPPKDSTTADSSTALTPTERRALKARAHSLAPVVLVGEKGLTGAVLAEIELALAAHELIKIRVDAARGERELRQAEICDRTRSAAVQHIGKVLVFFRPKPPAPAPKAPARRPPARKFAPRKPTLRKSATGKSATGKFGGSRTPAADARRAAPGGPGGGRPPAGGKARPARGARASAPATDTGRRESRSASPRQAPARPPGRRRTSR